MSRQTFSQVVGPHANILWGSYTLDKTIPKTRESPMNLDGVDFGLSGSLLAALDFPGDFFDMFNLLVVIVTLRLGTLS
jgi:hypothetical protein